MSKKHQESWHFPLMSCGNFLIHLQCEKEVLNDIEWTGWLQWMIAERNVEANKVR
jgi:hypothetical protein